MSDISRRDFLKWLSKASAAILASPVVPGIFAADGDSSTFEMLVVGDSIVWGQGLDEKDKFYSLIADWLRHDVFGGRREVNLKVKAHSGSTLKFHQEDAEKYKKAGRDETYHYDPEVNIGFPSIWRQIEVASDEYKAAGDRQGADLIMLTGGITDITVSKVLDPHGDDTKLPPLIEKYCRDEMFDVISHAAELNPNAVIAVIGYFPMVSPSSVPSRLFNSYLESMSFPRPFKPFVNNGIMRPLFFKHLQKRGIERSRIWVTESNKQLKTAVDKLNEKSGRTRAIFVRSPITEATNFETPNTLLFRMGKGGRTADPLYVSRKSQCDTELPELNRSTGIKYPVRLCEIAAVGHPDPAGARAYAEAIKAALGPVILQRSS